MVNAVKYRASAGLLLALGLLSMNPAVAGNCNDPWVTQAVTEALGRPPASALSPECNIKLYNNGRWNNYKELQVAVGGYWGTHAYPTTPAPGQNPGGSIQYTIPKATFDGLQKRNTSQGVQVNYQGQWMRLVGPDGASMKLIGNDAGSLRR